MKMWAEKRKFPLPSVKAFAERAGMWLTNKKRQENPIPPGSEEISGKSI
jgi:hypothetical protein